MEARLGLDNTKSSLTALSSPKCSLLVDHAVRVSIIEECLARRPPEMTNADSPFYLASIVKLLSKISFKKQPLGKDSLGSFLKSMSDAARLTGRHTNHSIRRTMISTLRKENVEPINIIGLAGQRNINSLDCYSSTSTEQQKDMSLKLSRYFDS